MKVIFDDVNIKDIISEYLKVKSSDIYFNPETQNFIENGCLELEVFISDHITLEKILSGLSWRKKDDR